MNNWARNLMAKELLDIARCLLASDYVHKNDYTDADEEERYASELAESVYDYFDGGVLKNGYAEYSISLSPKRYLKRNAVKDSQTKSYDVRVVMMYVDKVNGSFGDRRIQHAYNDGTGSGSAYTEDMNNLMIIMVGDSEDCCDENYFYETLAHELMHVLDNCAYPYYFSQSENYGRRTKHDVKRNRCVPYPTSNDDWLDEKFAEYYTCETEIREYRHDLKRFIDEYAEVTETEKKDVVNELIDLCYNQQNFIDYFNSCPVCQSALPTIYHLCFSKPSHGNKQTAIKILKGFL